MAVRSETLLKEYRRRRDFSRTSEPDETPRKRHGQSLSFVVQKHNATRLHYDFRLEWDGVLKSWAVTRGPSLDPSEKRLAVRTEDHPIAYGGFEGVIPEGEYGGGTVMLWDTGTWEPLDDPEKGLEEGKLSFRLNGERLKGEWALVRMRGREKRENWLLIKHDDPEADRRGDVLKKHSTSVASQRTMARLAKKGRPIEAADVADPPKPPSRKKQKARKSRRKAAHPIPRWREPQLATLVDDAPEGDEWLSEMKFDGYRTLIAVAGGEARIFTRNGKDWSEKFPEIAEAASALDTDGTLLDGEIVAFDKNGKTDFSTLQSAIKSHSETLQCFLFDMIEQDGDDIADLPLEERKERLERLLRGREGVLQYSTHVRGRSHEVFARICSAGHEGIVAKRADGSYRSGRGKSWLKIKCTRRQEFVVGGYSPTDKKSRPFSSLLIGVMEGKKLVYKGRVGSFEGDTLETLAPLIANRERKTSPFAALPASAARKARFVRPDLVAEIDFTEFTTEGYVRHGVFKGLREDKQAAEVVLESREGNMMTEHEERDSFAGVKLSSPGKVLFSGQGVTKADLAAHYERVAERILPRLESRLLSLVRCPDGADGQCFFQKHESKGFPKELKRTEITESGGKKDNYLYVTDLAGLIAGVQMGTLEFHIWGSRIDGLEKPDRLVFDLDPDEGLGFADVREAAFDLRDRLAGIGLDTVPLVTGGKGIHVVAPLERRAEWPQVKAFARGFAKAVAGELPERYVAEASKAKREGRIFIDWLRNERGATAIAPYSTRARKGAPVAMPVSWDELKGLNAANSFHLADIAERLDKPDPWADSDAWRQSVTKSMLDAVGGE